MSAQAQGSRHARWTAGGGGVKFAAMLRTILVSCLLLGGPREALAEGRDPAAARALAAMALDALEQRRPRLAAEAFDRAQRHDPHPLWLVAAADGWLMALEPERAVERLEAALGDARLPSKVRAEGLLETAKALAPLVARARAADAKGRADAAERWLEVHDANEHGRALLFAARALERHRRHAEAHRLYSLAAERGDLAAEEHAEIDAARSRLARLMSASPAAPRPSASSGRTGAGVLVGVGSALAFGSIGAFLVAADRRDTLDGALASGPLVTGMTRAEAKGLADEARAWEAGGWVALSVGAVVAGLGVWLLTEDEPRARVELAIGGGGASVVLRGALP